MPVFSLILYPKFKAFKNGSGSVCFMNEEDQKKLLE